MKRGWLLLIGATVACSNGDAAQSTATNGSSTTTSSSSGGSSSSSSSSSGGSIGVPCELDGVQHPTTAALAQLADNAALDLGAFPCTVPEGDGYACQQVTDYSGLVYDCKHHQLLMFGGGHATTFTDTVFAYDIASGSWSELYAPTPCTTEHMQMSNFDGMRAMWLAGPSGPYPRPLSRHTYDLLVYDDALDELVMLVGPNGDSSTCPPDSTGYDYAHVLALNAHYSLAAGTWSSSDTAQGDGHPSGGGSEYVAAELDPPSRSIVLLGRYGLYVYDPVARTKSIVVDNYNDSVFPEDLGYANHLVYFPPNDRFYYFDRISGAVWELAFDRQNPAASTLTKVAARGTPPPHSEPGYAYDAQHQIIGGAVTDDVFYAFDPATSTWTSKTIRESPGSLAFHAIAYDPVNGVFLFVTEGRRTWAYRYAP